MYHGPDPKRTQIPNDRRQILVHEADLPLHCPLPAMSLWNSHPQVYIPLEQPGQTAVCPYCGTEFRLAGEGAGGNEAGTR
ncbi:MAG TPA: zinc-finger domain-containing protein [Gammaproteobacteria bacterium]|nr:zinc-finger domain-containing protein [Gammaproteobacteria bacterium]